MIFQRCKLCGTRSDAFGCYETCTAEGPWHEWGDFMVEPDVVDAVPTSGANLAEWCDWAVYYG